MEDFLPNLLAYAVVLMVPAVLMVVLVVVLFTRLGEMSTRLNRLESAFRRQKQPARRTARESEPLTVLPVTRAYPDARPGVPLQRKEAEQVESWIGRRALGWIAAG